MKQQSTTKGFALLSIAGIICKILSLVYVPIQYAIVGDTGNDVIGFGYRIYVFMFSLSNAGLPASISKMVAEQNAQGNFKNSRRIFKIAIIILVVFGATFTTILALSAKKIAVVCKQEQTYLMLLTLSPVFILTSINCSLRGFLQGNQNMAPTAISNVVEQFLNSLCTVIFIYLLFNFTGNNLSQKYSHAAAGSAIGTIAGASGALFFLVFSYIVTRKQIIIKEKYSNKIGDQLTNRSIIIELMKYIVPAWIGSLATSAADIIDSVSSIPRMLAGGLNIHTAYILNGQYMTQYQRTLSITMIVATALMTTLIPSVSKACSLENKKMLEHSINSSFKVLFIFMVPIVMGFTFYAKPAISLIFFNINSGGSQFLSMWGWSILLSGIITIQSAILIGISRPLSAPINLIAGMIIKFILNYSLLCIPTINMHGAAIGSAAGWIVCIVLNDRVIRNVKGIKIRYISKMSRPLLFSLTIGFTYYPFLLLYKIFRTIFHVGLICNDLSLIVIIAVCVYIYAALILKFKLLCKEELMSLPMGKQIVATFHKLRLL